MAAYTTVANVDPLMYDVYIDGVKVPGVAKIEVEYDYTMLPTMSAGTTAVSVPVTGSAKYYASTMSGATTSGLSVTVKKSPLKGVLSTDLGLAEVRVALNELCPGFTARSEVIDSPVVLSGPSVQISLSKDGEPNYPAPGVVKKFNSTEIHTLTMDEVLDQMLDIFDDFIEHLEKDDPEPLTAEWPQPMISAASAGSVKYTTTFASPATYTKSGPI
jgi:hypothetical protein